jgi:HlyD family secretion protein
VIIILGAYWGYSKITNSSTETRYVTTTVQKGTIVSSISGSGQVSSQNQVDLKAKVSGSVLYLGASNGQEVKAGALLVQLDSTDAEKSVRDAEANLESAQLSLQKLMQPADELSITQSENTLARAQDTKQSAIDDLTKSYDDGFNTVSNVFLDLPTVVTGLHDILYGTTAGASRGNQANVDYYSDVAGQYSDKAQSYGDDAEAKYAIAKKEYDITFNNYKNTNRLSSTSSIEAILEETYATTKDIAEAVKSALNLIQFYEDQLTQQNITPLAIANTQIASLNTYTGKTNSDLTNLLNAINTIQDDKNAIVNADRSISENTQSLTKLKAGADSLDIASAELTIKQRQNALFDAQQKRSDYFIRAPFDGTVAKINVKKLDDISSGTSLVTFITSQKLVTITLNEVDIAKVQIGQKATMTFDAIEGLMITGKVIDIDTVGTVSQGVVNYTVTIGFDTQDSRVRSGMSVSAAIITNVKQDVLIVPNSSIKTSGNTTYIEIFNPALIGSDENTQGITSSVIPMQKTIEIGLSDDTSTEIVSGVDEGTQIVTRTISGATATTNTSTSLLGNILGGNKNASRPSTGSSARVGGN